MTGFPEPTLLDMLKVDVESVIESLFTHIDDLG